MNTTEWTMWLIGTAIGMVALISLGFAAAMGHLHRPHLHALHLPPRHHHPR